MVIIKPPVAASRRAGATTTASMAACVRCATCNSRGGRRRRLNVLRRFTHREIAGLDLLHHFVARLHAETQDRQ
jgi:hypothetical protein